jgi:hypothetical protein
LVVSGQCVPQSSFRHPPTMLLKYRIHLLLQLTTQVYSIFLASPEHLP